MPKGNWTEFGESFQNSSASNLVKNISLRTDREVRVQRTRVGKGGKTVTIITGLSLNDCQSKKLLKKLKKECGTGGTLKSDCIELQGDKVSVSIAILQKEGYRPKQSGG